jgi:hypothetical protein
MRRFSERPAEQQDLLDRLNRLSEHWESLVDD